LNGERVAVTGVAIGLPQHIGHGGNWRSRSRPPFQEKVSRSMSGIARQSTARRGLGAAVNASQRHYPMSEMRPALQLLAAADTADAGAGIILEYTNRVTGGPVMPTIACHM